GAGGEGGGRKRKNKKAEENQEGEGQRAGPASRFFLVVLFVCFVSFVVYVLFFHRLANRDLWSSHEARAAMDAQTILDDGTWALPHLYGGQVELQKPPLYYWLVALVAPGRGGLVDSPGAVSPPAPAPPRFGW